jgi:hypothetical protein
LGRRQGVGTRLDGDRSWPGRPPRVKLVAVGDAHEVAVPRGLKVQASESDFESGWEGVRATHGVPLAPTRCGSPSRWLVEADLQRAVPYLARQLSVQKVVPTLTSKSVEIYLSMADAKQLVTQGLSWFRPGPYVQQGCARGTILRCTVVLARGGLQARRERRLGLQVLEVF